MSSTRPAPDPGARPPRPLLGALLILGAAALWGSFGIFARALFEFGFSALELASLRVTIALLATMLIVLLRPRPLARLRIAPRDVAFFAVYGTFGFASFVVLFFATVEITTVAVAAALLYTAPAFVVVLSRLIWGESFDAATVAALACVLAGVFAVTGAFAVFTGEAHVPAAAVATGLGSGLTYGLYTVMSKVATRRFDAVTTIFWVFLFAGALLALAAPPWSAATRAPAAAWPLLLGLGLGPSLLSYFLFLWGLRELAAGTASMLAAVEPVMAAIFAALLLAEPLDAPRLLGIGLIVGAAMLLVRRAGSADAPIAQSSSPS